MLVKLHLALHKDWSDLREKIRARCITAFDLRAQKGIKWELCYILRVTDQPTRSMYDEQWEQFRGRPLFMFPLIKIGAEDKIISLSPRLDWL